MINSYEITILYAHHGAEDHIPEKLPKQSFPTDKIQILPVWENDLCQLRKNSLSMLSLAKGKYLIMLDEGDLFEPTLLKEMVRIMERENPVFVMPALSCQSPCRNPNYFVTKEQEDIRVDTVLNPVVFPTELHGILFKTNELLEAAAQITLPVEYEKQILLCLLKKQPDFFYLGSHRLRYIQPRECNLEYNMNCQTSEWYYAPFEQFLLPLFRENSQNISLCMQYMALHMVHIRILSNLDNRNKHVIPPENVLAYTQLLAEVLQFISTEVLVLAGAGSRCAMADIKHRLFYLRLKKRDFSWYPKLKEEDGIIKFFCDGNELYTSTQLSMRIMLLEYRNGNLEIDGEYDDFFSREDAEVYARFAEKIYPLKYNRRYSLTKYFGVSVYRKCTFHLSIPVSDFACEGILNFVLRFQGKEFVMPYAFPHNTARFAKDFNCIHWEFADYLSYWRNDGIHIVRYSKKRLLKKEFGLWLQMWKKKKGHYRMQLPVKILNFLLRPYFSHQKIWLFLDKIYKGGDSSEYMYRYALTQNDGIKKYYLLDKTSADYSRMKKEGYRPLIRDSLKHRLIFLNASMVIASNSTVFAFNGYTFGRSLPIRGDVHFDVACVQHGMSVQKIALAQQRLRDHTALYFCASKYEIENLSKPIYDYNGYDALKLTGVPRYDGLVNRAQKILVISPTWRMQSALPVTKTESVARDYNPNFKETNYYKVYNSLINDPRLLAAARKYGYRIQYILHPIVSPQYEDFVTNDLVELIPAIGSMSYEKIFCEGALMVTDFSGVQFDFAYMRKPVIYLHHNDIPQHYEEGTFFYDTMGFGEICHTNDELIDVLCQYMRQDCKMPDFYRQRADDFFAFSDHHNCERIYPIMLEHEKMRG